MFQTTGQKAESETEQAAKRRKVGITGNTTVPYTQRSSDSVSGTESSHAEMIDKKKASVFSESPKTNRNVVLQEVTCSKQLPVRPIASVDPPFLMNRYKLDNRSTVFRVLPPLPAGFENVSLFTLPEFPLDVKGLINISSSFVYYFFFWLGVVLFVICVHISD